MGKRRLQIVSVPTNLGLRPPAAGREPGVWRAPTVLQGAGLREALGVTEVVEVPRPAYDFEAQPGTRIRNGVTLRRHALQLAAVVGDCLESDGVPLVLGGDCSILLGCLVAARRRGPLGLIHIDGHSDFRHPGNYDTASNLGTAAGMDLALVTGRGELLLTDWPEAGFPLVEDAFVVQVGERDDSAPDFGYPDITMTKIRRIPVREILDIGISATVARMLAPVHGEYHPLWIHVDIDVLDAGVMPAVDSPGSPGLSFNELTELIGLVGQNGRPLGMNLTIYDPELDPEHEYARRIVECVAGGISQWKL